MAQWPVPSVREAPHRPVWPDFPAPPDEPKRQVMKSKYIIVKHAGMEIPIVFSPLLLHTEVAGKKQVRSAGFCKLDAAGKWIVGGQSVSLALNARRQDAEILNTHL